MGTWGYGILQNDIAQDGMCDLANAIETDITSFSKNASEENAAKLGAAVGLLLQFSHYSFNPDNRFSKTLINALRINQNFFNQLPGNSAKILTSILEGRGLELAERPGVFEANIDKALHSDENDGFPMQKAFSVSEDDLFRHLVAADYLQNIIDKIVKYVDEGFQEGEEIVGDLSREADFMGHFALLLILPKAKVDANKFVQWREKFHKVKENMEPYDDEIEKNFEEKYNHYLDIAFECGVKRYSS